jgi:hypothetical protein
VSATRLDESYIRGHADATRWENPLTGGGGGGGGDADVSFTVTVTVTVTTVNHHHYHHHSVMDLHQNK